ncbi:hypothetical protein HQ308_14940 [Rhodococcus sp. BP-241]|uniref:DUF6338 family protein n=1 Tax=Rhodococcus sp. BP-241 TaxID=2739441 RepID=UPI001C9B24B2|nr:DUF6338 family protein [Rhodococcus sp. BP-241]MBY6708100.1 hypothetical protein [Rhodococcus sp. BP-241]
MSLPDSFLGLVLFVVLLAPGLVSVQTGPRNKPIAKPTALREIAGIVFRSLISLSAASAVMAVVRHCRPNNTPDVRRLINEPGTYLPPNYVSVVAWGLATLALACLFAWLWSTFANTKTYQNWSKSTLATKLKPKHVIETSPAWWVMFKPEESEQNDFRAMADITVDGGVVFSGEVFSFSPEADEHADRELTLIEPIYRMTPAPTPNRGRFSFRSQPDPDPENVKLDASLFGISAREIKHIAVRWESASASE